MKLKKMRLSFVIICLVSMFILTSVSNSFSLNINPVKPNLPKTTESWTFMLYFCADTRDDYVTYDLNNANNWLGEIMLETMNLIESSDLYPGSESDLNVIALFDHPYEPINVHGNAKYYEIQYGNLIELEELGPKNLGLSSTLEEFIDYCKLNYPATNYALTLSNHGRGYAGFCYDYHGIHPYWEYALGDCLSVEEVGDALDNAGGIDVLFMDVCLGGSFEAMWEFSSSVDYAVAGESLLIARVLSHSRDILYALSRDTTMTPLELATVGFDSAVNPVRVPSDPQASTLAWPSVALYDLTKIDYIPASGISFRSIFTNFASELYSELLFNLTYGRINFGEIRNSITYHEGVFKSSSMMVDLSHFVDVILSNTSRFHFEDEIEAAAVALANRLAIGENNLIIDEFHLSQIPYGNLSGFSICFPNTGDLYQQFLYPNFYENMEISVNTLWENFIFKTYPSLPSLIFPIPEFYEVNLNPIDPGISLHLFIKEELVTDPPRHVGLIGGEIAQDSRTFMGIELGIEGVQFEDNLLYGTSMLIIPSSSIPALSKSTGNSFTIVVNASTAATATQMVNLTIKHVKGTEVLWEDTMIKDIQIGQALTTEISTDEDEWTDFEVIEYNISTTRGFIGIEKPILFSAGVFTLVIVTFVIIKKRKKR